MGEITFAVGIPHKQGDRNRDNSLERLLRQLDLFRENAVPGRLVKAFRVFDSPAKNWEWSGEMWRWAAETGASHFLQLQDDIITTEGFWDVLEALVSARPNRVIGLHSPVGFMLPAETRLYQTRDALIGTGYVLPLHDLKAFLTWRDDEVQPGGVEQITEDTLLAVYCLCRRNAVLHTQPALIDHDVSLASTYGNDNHYGRRPLNFAPLASEAMRTADHWATGKPLTVGRYYDATQNLAKMWVKTYSYAEYKADATALREQREGQMQRKIGVANLEAVLRPRIVVATPHIGEVAIPYVESLVNLMRWPEIEFHHATFYDDDVVRARSRLVRRFLASNATHLVFWDGDVAFEPICLASMVRATLLGGHDFVAAPYPKKQAFIDRTQAIALGMLKDGITPPPAEALAYDYPIHILPSTNPGSFTTDKWGCAEVVGVGLGCAVITRQALQTLSDAAVAEGLVFRDKSEGGVETPCPFYLIFEKDKQELWSEDFSFCKRWRDLGGKVQLYLGAGAPASHFGMHLFRGRPEAFGRG